MNKITGTITKITSDNLFVKVDIQSKGYLFSACVIQAGYGYTDKDIGTPVTMLFKETDTIISHQNEIKISCRNSFPSIVTSITYGPVLSRISTKYKENVVTSLITSESAQSMNLKKGDSVICLVKSTSVMLYQGEYNSDG
ncbi:MAG: TOBE domain-containing protein [Fibrobacter sp.]|nr:TOBE domain-containing protein [Fibrobacter sp.]